MAFTEFKKISGFEKWAGFRKWAGIGAICVLGGCISVADHRSASAPASGSGTTISADNPTGTAENAVADNSGENAPPPFLTYEWNTGFSGFLSPPIEVRRAAKADCVAEGYELAVVETMMLNGDVATAIYLCHGDTE
jgi:hypothetical protein